MARALVLVLFLVLLFVLSCTAAGTSTGTTGTAGVLFKNFLLKNLRGSRIWKTQFSFLRIFGATGFRFLNGFKNIWSLLVFQKRRSDGVGGMRGALKLRIIVGFILIYVLIFFVIFMVADRKEKTWVRQKAAEHPCVLGSTNPCPTCVHIEPFSTSVFKVLI